MYSNARDIIASSRLRIIATHSLASAGNLLPSSPARYSAQGLIADTILAAPTHAMWISSTFMTR